MKLVKGIPLPPITLSDSPLRFACYFETSERFRQGLQLDDDLEKARGKLGSRVMKELRPQYVGR